MTDAIGVKKSLLSAGAIAVFLAVSATGALAYQSPGNPAGLVNDYAGILTSGARQALEQRLTQFEKETSNEITVVTISTLGGDTIENFAEKLFNEWGIGKKDKDNGVLILVAKEDRKMRIEVGYGLEGALTDAQSYWIIQNIMRPAFQQNDFAGGISGAVDKIIAATEGEYVPSEKATNTSKINFDLLWLIILFAYFIIVWLGAILARSKSWWAGGIVGLILGALFLIFISAVIGIIAIAILVPLGLLFDYSVSKNYRERKRLGMRPAWWAGGGFGGGGSGGGGFGGFGGGGSGGGGSSGGW